MTARGRFIVLEGGDGAGKGGAIAILAACLRDEGYPVLTTREPGGTPEGLQLRALLLAAEGAVWDRGSELLLMTAARVQHVRRVIEPALQAGTIVLCDRFLGSSLAYQGGGRGIPADLILDLHRRFVGDFWPDLTILLDVDPETGLSRSRRRLGDESVDEGRFEALDHAFHDRVRRSFLDQAARHAARTILIDAGRPIDAVQRDVVDQVRIRLAQFREIDGEA
jgi:dTMP kinase